MTQRVDFSGAPTGPLSGVRIVDLVGDLRAGKRGVRRDVNGLQSLERQVRDDPFPTIFGDVNDRRAWPHP